MGKLCLGVQMTCSVEHQLESKDLNLGLQDIKEEEEPGHQTGRFMHSFIHSFIPASFIHSRVHAEDKHRIRAHGRQRGDGGLRDRCSPCP